MGYKLYINCATVLVHTGYKLYINCATILVHTGYKLYINCATVLVHTGYKLYINCVIHNRTCTHHNKDATWSCIVTTGSFHIYFQCVMVFVLPYGCLLLSLEMKITIT